MKYDKEIKQTNKQTNKQKMNKQTNRSTPKRLHYLHVFGVVAAWHSISTCSKQTPRLSFQTSCICRAIHSSR